MKDSTIQGLIATFQAIANMTEDEAIVATCREAIARAEADNTITAEIPEPLMVAINGYMVAGWMLAKGLSTQPIEAKGKPVEMLLKMTLRAAIETFLSKPRDQQLEQLKQAAQHLGEFSGAIAVECSDIEP